MTQDQDQDQAEPIDEPEVTTDPDDVEEPDDVPEPDVEDPDESGSSFTIAPQMVYALIIVAVLVFIVVNYAAWHWVVNTSEKNEKGDWAQLRSIKGSLTQFAMFLLGGFLGFQAQRGATEKAKGKARKNRDAAKEQHKVAKHRSKVAHERGQRLRSIHGKTIDTLKHQRREGQPRGRLMVGAQHLDLVNNAQLDLTNFDSGRVVLDSDSDEIQRQLLEIAELSAGE